MDLPDPRLVTLALAAVGALVLLVTWLKLNAFLALLGVALVFGRAAGLSWTAALGAFQDGMGATLGGVAAVLVLGAMIGRLLAESGGADVLARRFMAFLGPARAGLCVMALALAVGFTTWFAVGLVLLVPVLATMVRDTGRPLLSLALPLLAGLSVMHGLVPPHPGPVIAASALGANPGLVVLWGLVIGLPTAALAGPLFARYAVRHVAAPAEAPAVPAGAARAAERRTPGFGLTLLIILLPLVLMLTASAAGIAGGGGRVRGALVVLGHPTLALALSALLAGWALGTRCGFSRAEVLTISEQAVAGIGMAVLVVGAGGGFARVLRDAGVATALGEMARGWHLPPLVYAWLLTAFVRVATGSATVAITAAAGLLAPDLATMPGVNRELLVVAVGCGSLFLSHLNDGGFWLVQQSLGLTVGQTLRTWTVTETIVGIAGLALTVTADALLRWIA
jgi:GntP family gluconate:H+ symporter